METLATTAQVIVKYPKSYSMLHTILKQKKKKKKEMAVIFGRFDQNLSISNVYLFLAGKVCIGYLEKSKKIGVCRIIWNAEYYHQ